MNEFCVHCKREVVLDIYIKNEWTHWNGSMFCLDSNGFTATPLRRARPSYHSEMDVL